MQVYFTLNSRQLTARQVAEQSVRRDKFVKGSPFDDLVEVESLTKRFEMRVMSNTWRGDQRLTGPSEDHRYALSQKIAACCGISNFKSTVGRKLAEIGFGANKS